MKRKNGFGWSELIVGVLLILLGIFAFIRPESMLTGAVVIYGVIAIVMVADFGPFYESACGFHLYDCA